MAKRKTLISCIFALVLIIFSLSVATYAWFTFGFDSSNTKIGFKTGKVYVPPVHVWRYLSENDGVTTPSWEEISNQDGDNLKIKPVIISEDESGVEIEVSSLHLGILDNLIAITEDNFMYMRFDLENISSVVPKLDIPDSNPFEIYQYITGDGVNITFQKVTDTETINKINQINDSIQFLSYSYCFSDQELAPGDSGFKNLEFSENIIFGSSEDELFPDGLSGNYYMYVKITPSLIAISEASENLSKYMPCAIIIDAVLEITFR